jgi:uncharacterized protein (TIGR00730 family)
MDAAAPEPNIAPAEPRASGGHVFRAKHVCDPVTLEHLQQDIELRVKHVSNELRAGLEFIGSCQPSVTILGSAVTPEGHPEYEKARRVAARIAKELDYAIVTGGAGGIMEAGNRGASEVGGTSIGMTIQLPNVQSTNRYINRHIDFYYFFTRKVCLAYSAEAYLFFPGGFGTHDELMEILTLVQTAKMEAVPIILVGVVFWQPFVAYVRDVLLAAGKIDRIDPDLFRVTDDEDEIVRAVAHAKVRHVIQRASLDARADATPRG